LQKAGWEASVYVAKRWGGGGAGGWEEAEEEEAEEERERGSPEGEGRSAPFVNSRHPYDE
jgi:hypothetical protein